MTSYGKKMLEAALQQNSKKSKQASFKTVLVNCKGRRQQTAPSSSFQDIQVDQMQQLPQPQEKDKLEKVSKWLQTCPDSVSAVEEEIQSENNIPPSVSSKVNDSAFPVLFCGVQSDIDSMEDENDKDYQPSSDDEDSIVVPYQTVNETSTRESQQEKGSDDEDSLVIPSKTSNETSTRETQFVSHAISRNGAVVLNKQQYCYFCEKPQLKLARHLTSLHKTESAVAQVLATKNTNPRKYQRGLKRIKCLGNFIHNVKSLKEKKCDIVVVKRPTKPRTIYEYLPCIHCYGFYVEDELWKHTKNCDLKCLDKNPHLDIYDESKKLLTTGIGVIHQARLLLDTACIPEESALSDEMHTLILTMHQDELSEVVRKDALLNQFGETLLVKYGPRRKNDIGQRLRQLSRLLLQCRMIMSDSSLQYMDLLCGKHFDTCLSGTFDLCKSKITDDGRREFQIPSLALRLGHLLKKMATIKQGYCLRKDHEQGLKEAESFGQLLQAEWTDAIASNAHNTLKRRKDQTIQVLPLTDDLRQLRQYQMEEMKRCIAQLSDTPLYSTWRKLAQLTMTRMIIFNKRRGGEVSKFLLMTYNTRPDWKQSTNQEVLSSLQPLEQKLLDRVDLVQIPGKKNRKVPMLITTDVKEAIETLNANRDKVGIPSSNPFCFASRSAGHLDSWQAMSSISQEASLKQPELVTSTKLRKYNATVSQLFDLNHGELEWLSNHMGHDLNIHKDFYRLHDSTIEIAKVSRLLMAIDTGNAAQFVGKQLTEISLEEFGYGDINELSETDKVERSHTDVTVTQTVHESNDDERPQNSQQEFNLHNLNRSKGNEEDENSDTLIQDVDELQKPKRNARKRRIASDSEDEDSRQNKMNKINQKSCWSSQEIQSLRKTFGEILKQGIYPSGKQIQTAISQNACLKKRTVLNIRAKLQHLMKKNKN